MQGTIIVVDDNKGVLSAVKLLLKNSFERIITLTSPITLPAVLREENAQVVLLDMNFSSGLNTYNPQIQISAESETKRSIFREKDKTKRSKKESAQHSKSRNKSFVMTSVSAL